MEYLDLVQHLGPGPAPGVHNESNTLTVYLPAMFMENLEAGVSQHLLACIATFHPLLNGILIGFDQLQLCQPQHNLINENNQIELSVRGHFWLFRPTKGLKLDASVVRCDDTRLICLAMGLFSVSCSRPKKRSPPFGKAVTLKVISVNTRVPEAVLIEGRVVDWQCKELSTPVRPFIHGLNLVQVQHSSSLRAVLLPQLPEPKSRLNAAAHKATLTKYKLKKILRIADQITTPGQQVSSAQLSAPSTGAPLKSQTDKKCKKRNEKVKRKVKAKVTQPTSEDGPSLQEVHAASCPTPNVRENLISLVIQQSTSLGHPKKKKKKKRHRDVEAVENGKDFQSDDNHSQKMRMPENCAEKSPGLLEEAIKRKRGKKVDADLSRESPPDGKKRKRKNSTRPGEQEETSQDFQKAAKKSKKEKTKAADASNEEYSNRSDEHPLISAHPDDVSTDVGSVKKKKKKVKEEFDEVLKTEHGVTSGDPMDLNSTKKKKVKLDAFVDLPNPSMKNEEDDVMDSVKKKKKKKKKDKGDAPDLEPPWEKSEELLSSSAFPDESTTMAGVKSRKKKESASGYLPPDVSEGHDTTLPDVSADPDSTKKKKKKKKKEKNDDPYESPTESPSRKRTMNGLCPDASMILDSAKTKRKKKKNQLST